MQLHASAQTLAGVAVDHMPGLYGLAILPLVLWIAFSAVLVAERSGPGWALRLAAGWRGADLRIRLTTVLLAATALIHFGLVPGHADAAPQEALLFLANGCLFAVASVTAVLGLRFWRPAVAVLLGVTIVAYGIFVAGGREHVDDLGVVTKLIELMAFGLVVMPRRQPARLGGRVGWGATAFAVVFLTAGSGALAWGAGLRDGVGADHQPIPDAAPSASQRLAAQAFADTTWADIARYQDVNAALEAGFRPTTPPNQATVHYMNSRWEKEHPYMNPNRPQGLVYTGGSHPVLLGAMYELGAHDARGNNFGGVVTGWHTHQNVCISVLIDLGGFTSPFGNCPPLTFNISTNPMLHVWRPENPNGQFGELDEKWAKRVAAAGVVA